MNQTDRLALPMLAAGQTQREWFVNESLATLDALVMPIVEAGPQNSPPTNPAPGQSFAIANAPTGDWAGHALDVATWSTNGWRIIPFADGFRARVRSNGHELVRTASGWEWGVSRAAEVRVDGVKVVGQQAAAIPNPSSGTTVDSQARSAVVAILSALRGHGLIAP